MNTVTQNSISCESKRRLFVGCMAAYNSGFIHGEWVNLGDYYDFEELQDKVNDILKSSPYQGEEYDIQDYEGFGDLFKGSIYPSIKEAWAIHETLLQVEQERIDTDLFLEFVNETGCNDFLSDNCILDKFQESYRGCFDSIGDYAEDLTSDCDDLNSIPKHIRTYIDFDYMGKDMELSGDIFTITTGYKQVHVFSNY